MCRRQTVSLNDQKVNPDDKAESDASKPKGMTQKIRKCFGSSLRREPIIATRDVVICKETQIEQPKDECLFA